MAIATSLAQLFGRAGFAQGRNPTTASLPPGYILEHGAQHTQGFQPAHQAMVDNATSHAADNPLINFLPGGRGQT